MLMLDEPTAHLDLNHQLDVCQILQRVHEQLQMTVLLVSHDINLASQYCDRILVMKQGAVVSSTGRDSSAGLDRGLWVSGAGRHASGHGVAASLLARSGSSSDRCRSGDVVSVINTGEVSYPICPLVPGGTV